MKLFWLSWQIFYHNFSLLLAQMSNAFEAIYVLSLKNERHNLRFVLKSKVFVHVLFFKNQNRSVKLKFLHVRCSKIDARSSILTFIQSTLWVTALTDIETNVHVTRWVARGNKGFIQTRVDFKVIYTSCMKELNKKLVTSNISTIMSFCIIIHDRDEVTFLRDQETWNALGCDCFDNTKGTSFAMTRQGILNKINTRTTGIIIRGFGNLYIHHCLLNIKNIQIKNWRKKKMSHDITS